MKTIEPKMSHHDLTHPQKRIWYTQELYHSPIPFNVGGSVILNTSADFDILKKAILKTISLHDAIRIRIALNEGMPYQYIAPYNPIDIGLVDFSNEEDPWQSHAEWVTHIAGQPFELINHPLFFFSLIQIDQGHTGFFLKFHHIIIDGWSIEIITNNIRDYYLAETKNGEHPAQTPTFFEYIEEERTYKSSRRFSIDQDFWNSAFRHLPEPIELGKSVSMTGKRKTFTFNSSVCAEIKKFCINNNVSLPTFLCSAYVLMLARFYQKTDIVVGIPVLNRSSKYKQTVGMFVSTVPLKVTIDNETTVGEFIELVSKETKKCLLHQKYPYDLLVQDISLRKQGREGLFEFSFNFYNTKIASDYNGITIRNEEFHCGEQIYALQLMVKQWDSDESISINFDYKTFQFNENTIKSFYDCYETLITQFLLKTSDKIKNIEIVSDKVKKFLLTDFNETTSDYPLGKTVIDLIEEQVNIKPESIALSYNNIKITYRELWSKVNDFAGVIKNHCLPAQSIVAIMGENTPELIISILSVLKSGHTFLPIDMEYPADRKKYMLEQANVSLVITDYPTTIKDYYSGDIIDLSEPLLVPKNEKTATTLSSHDIAYIIYTSGTTGKPKGVMVSNKNLTNYLCWAKELYVKNENDVFAFYTSIAFDLTMTSIFIPLISGIECRIFRRDTSEYVLYSIVRENRATIIKLTPSHLHLIKHLKHSNKSLRTFIVGGENLKSNLASSIYHSFNQADIFNEYGPTETTVGCMYHRYNPSIDINPSVYIGKPAANVQLYILNSNHQLMPLESKGELYISGEGVAQGYLKNKIATNGSFMINPFEPEKTMYKTGDLVRMSSNGNIMYIGRNDQQVKIQGYRIEIEEIEHCLLEHDAISDVAVKIETTKGGTELFAFAVARKQVTEWALKEHLKKFLPVYMIPSAIVFLNKMPVNQNGKVDRGLLTISIYREDSSNKAKLPSQKIESLVIAAIEQVLQNKNIDLDSNFLSIGGDSVKAIQVSHKLNHLGLEVNAIDILDQPRISDIIACVKVSNNENSHEMPYGEIKPVPIIQWLLNSKHLNPNYYLQSVLLNIPVDYDLELIQWAFQRLIKHHDALRLNIDNSGTLFYNNTLTGEKININAYDLSHSFNIEKDIKIISETIKKSVKVEDNLPFSVGLIKTSETTRCLLIAIHHIAIDAVSWRILLEDFLKLTTSIKQNPEAQLPRKKASYQQWATKLHEHATEFVKNQKKYWFEANETTIIKPTAPNQGPCKQGECLVKQLELSEELTNGIFNICHQAYNTRNDELFKIAFALTLSHFHKTEQVVFMVEGHGRDAFLNDIDVSSTIGWFTALYPLKLEILHSLDIKSQIRQLKDSIRNVPNGGIGYGIMRFGLNELKRDSMDYLYNYLGNIEGIFNINFSKSMHDTGADIDPENSFPFIMEMNSYIENKTAKVTFKFNPTFFNDVIIVQFLNQLEHTLRNIYNHCSMVDRTDYTPSDFKSINISQEELDYLLN